MLYRHLKWLSFNNGVPVTNGQAAIDSYNKCEPGYFKMMFFNHHKPNFVLN